MSSTSAREKEHPFQKTDAESQRKGRMDVVPQKFLKKMTKPVDEWLMSQGFLRRDSPRDASCLFRAVSEQVYDNQQEHERVRKECIDFMRKNPRVFEKNITISVENYLNQKAYSKEHGGENEMLAMSKLYKRDFIVFEFPKCVKINVTKNGYKEFICLCHYAPKQYDSVFTKEFLSGASVCQSIVYKTLYENVFKMPDVDSVAQKVLQQGKEKEHAKKYNEFESEESSDLVNYQVAKALDPHTYQNTYLDMYHETKKEARNAGIMKSNTEFEIGSHCRIQLEPEGGNVGTDQSESQHPIYYGYIQEMLKNEGPVLVYIEKLARKVTVPFSSLKPVIPNRRNNSWGQNSQTHWKNRSNGNQQNGRGKRPWNPPRKSKNMGHGYYIASNAKQDNNNNEDANDEQRKEMEKKNDGVNEEKKGSPEKPKPLQQLDKKEDKKLVVTPNAEHQNQPKVDEKKTERKQENDKNKTEVGEPSKVLQNVAADNVVENQKSEVLETEKDGPIEALVNYKVSKSLDINGKDLPYSDPVTLRYFFNLGVDHFQNKLTEKSGTVDETTPKQVPAVLEETSAPNSQPMIGKVAEIPQEKPVRAHNGNQIPSPKKVGSHQQNDGLQVSPNGEKIVQDNSSRYSKPLSPQEYQGRDNGHDFGKGLQQRDNFQNMSRNPRNFAPRFQRYYGGNRNNYGMQRFQKPEYPQQNYHPRTYNNSSRVARSEYQPPRAVEGNEGQVQMHQPQNVAQHPPNVQHPQNAQHPPNMHQFQTLVHCPPAFNQPPMYGPIPVFNHENGEIFQNPIYQFPHPNMMPPQPPQFSPNMDGVASQHFFCPENVPPQFPVYQPVGFQQAPVYNCHVENCGPPPMSVPDFNATVPCSSNQTVPNPQMQPNNRR